MDVCTIIRLSGSVERPDVNGVYNMSGIFNGRPEYQNTETPSMILQWSSLFANTWTVLQDNISPVAFVFQDVFDPQARTCPAWKKSNFVF